MMRVGAPPAKPEIKLSDLQDPAVENVVRSASKSPF
jgi:hypothetical protein